MFLEENKRKNWPQFGNFKSNFQSTQPKLHFCTCLFMPYHDRARNSTEYVAVIIFYDPFSNKQLFIFFQMIESGLLLQGLSCWIFHPSKHLLVQCQK